MRRIILAIAISCILGASVSAQESTYVFSVELGAGLGPLHMSWIGVCPTSAEIGAHRGIGQAMSRPDELAYPGVSLSVVWQNYERSEVVLSGGMSWGYSNVSQFEQFGWAPDGRPRYDMLGASTSSWTEATKPVFSATLQFRYIWTPDSKVKAYSAFGLGYSPTVDLSPVIVLPCVTPIAARYFVNKHFYVFVENALNPLAFLAMGGAAWRF